MGIDQMGAVFWSPATHVLKFCHNQISGIVDIIVWYII